MKVLLTLDGCDSIVYTTIEVIDVDIVQNDTSICLGDSLALNTSFSPSITITLNSSIPGCAWIALNTSFANYSNNVYGYEYYCSCWPTGCPNTATGTFISPPGDIYSLGTSMVNAINQNSNYFSATFNALTYEVKIYSTINDISTMLSISSS